MQGGCRFAGCRRRELFCSKGNLPFAKLPKPRFFFLSCIVRCLLLPAQGILVRLLYSDAGLTVAMEENGPTCAGSCGIHAYVGFILMHASRFVLLGRGYTSRRALFVLLQEADNVYVTPDITFKFNRQLWAVHTERFWIRELRSAFW